MQCKDCKYWQGHKHDEWADCYRVIGHLKPELLSCENHGNEEEVLQKFTVPFDPHDIKYWVHNDVFKLFLRVLLKTPLPDGCRKLKQKREDIKYDATGGERTGKVTLHYFQTHKDFSCKGG